MGIISSIFVGLGAAVLVKISTVGVIMGLFMFFGRHEKDDVASIKSEEEVICYVP